MGKGANYEVFAIAWPAFGDVHGEGLLLVPTGRAAVADVVAIPDCAVTPEQLVGLAPGVAAPSQFARRLAESGCRVVVPTLVHRGDVTDPISQKKIPLSTREWIYRGAYEMGRTPTGYEVQKILALVDFFATEAGDKPAKIGVIGWGEGGLLALYSARSISGSPRSARVAISTIATICGASRSIATCSGCWNNSAMPSWPA